MSGEEKLLKIFALLLLLASQVLLGQNNPLISGDNPSVQLGTTRFNIGTVRVVSGNGMPGTVNAPNGVALVLGDFYLDQISKGAYQCFATSGPCTAVASGNWTHVGQGTTVPVTSFGINNTSTDAANFQTALTTAAAGNFCLLIPDGTIVNMSGGTHVTLPTGTCLLGESQTGSQIQAVGLSTANIGVLDIPAGNTNITLKNFFLDGGVTTPAQINYSSLSSGPMTASLTTGSSIWAHGGNINVVIDHLTWNHTGGYAALFDATNGNIGAVTITNSIDQNARPALFGVTTGQLKYGSYVGGILFHGPGATFNFAGIVVDSNKFQNVVGNCVWFSNATGTLLSRDVRISNNQFVDVGLDAIQPAWIEGYLEYGNRVSRFGYVVTSDVGASRVGGPLWLTGHAPVAFDGLGTIQGFVRNSNFAEGNGNMFNLDGATTGTVAGNNTVSCFSSSDPLANSGSCGPSATVGQNFSAGLSVNDSGGSFTPSSIAITGNSFIGVGFGGVLLYPCQQCVVAGNTINQTADNGHPITLGNISTSGSGHTTGTLVSNNNIMWSPGSSLAAVFEDGTTVCACPFFNTDVNTVRGNVLVSGSSAFEFGKATPDFSGSGPLYLDTVTPGGTTAWQTILKTVNASPTNPVLQVITNPGSGPTTVGQFGTNGFIPLSVNFAGLPASTAAGQVVFCTNCNAASPCTSGGTGRLAVANGSQWNCN